MPNIGERESLFGRKEYEINDLQLTIDHYEYISEFCVITLLNKEVDIILGRPWFKELGTFILNTKNKFLMFLYKKMVTFQDMTTKSKLIMPSAKDPKDILKLMFQENPKAVSKKQKELEEVISNKNKENSCLKEHNQKLLTQVRKCKSKKHQWKQEKKIFENKLNESLSRKEEESLCLKNLNQRLLEQIKCLKDETLNDQDKVDSENEELLRLRNHN